jgi:PleD family two-component response regulator
MGAVVFDPCKELSTAESLLAVADQALYVAKAAGRNRMVLQSAVSVGACQ